jgi:S-DNA-T family DNA segregation ATPase FtsK/SpoIIIE
MLGVVIVAWLLWRHPKVLAVLAALVAIGLAMRYPVIQVAVLVIGLVLVLWRLVHARSFRRCVSDPLRRARRRRRYRGCWRSLMAVHRLSWAPHPRTAVGQRATPTWDLLSARPPVPKLERIELGAWVDRLRVRMLPGQTPKDWEDAAEGIAHALGARSAQVRLWSPGRLVLEVAYADPLGAVIPPVELVEALDLRAVPVGVREDGSAWQLPIAESHALLAGATGSGKSGLVHALLWALAPEVYAGRVQLWGIDPKGGMELLPARPLFTVLAVDDFQAMADLLDQAVIFLEERARRLADQGIRRHIPTADEPLIVVLIDELATLTAYLPDRKLSQRIANTLGMLLTKGRAVGVVVVAALQDPRKEVVGFRNLFPCRVALRLDDLGHVDMVLGDGARDQGARCDLIPRNQAGVGYMRIDGIREPVRVRASWVSDAHMQQRCERYPTARPDWTKQEVSNETDIWRDPARAS